MSQSPLIFGGGENGRKHNPGTGAGTQPWFDGYEPYTREEKTHDASLPRENLPIFHAVIAHEVQTTSHNKTQS
jgi:hypothetical protein